MSHSLSDTLQKTLEVPDGTPISIGDLTDRAQEKGFGLILLILSLPSALPVPAPGYSTPFGIALIILGLQMLRGCRKPLLFKKARNLELSYRIAEKMIGSGAKFLKKLEKIIRPRNNFLTSNQGHRVMGLVVMLMAALMILPIPFTNTAPAGVIFLIGAALSEEDGLLLFLTFLLGTFAVVLYSFILFWCFPLLLKFGWSATDEMRELVIENLKGLF